MTFSFALMGAEPALALCPAWNCANGYAIGAKASYGGLDYTLTAGARGANTMCAYPPNTDNWWSQTGSCSGATPTATATARPGATATATNPSRATATATTVARATATSRPRATATATSGSTGIGSIVTQSHFETIWPNGSRNASYQYADFKTAADTYYPALCGTGDTNTKKRECAAYFANKNQETGTGQYDRELYCQPGGGGYGSAACNYCGAAGACGSCASGQQYWGRFAIQLSWNYNYCAAQSGAGAANLHNDPNSMFNNRVTGWRVAHWYWMTQLGPQKVNWDWESAHDAITTTGSNGNYGFGGTIRAINGALECTIGQAQQVARIKFYSGPYTPTSGGPDYYGADDNDNANGGTLQVLGYGGGNFGRRSCY